ncbi:MAG: hypothetical protein WKG01_15780 [Kofleriaceae bacterium]
MAKAKALVKLLESDLPIGAEMAGKIGDLLSQGMPQAGSATEAQFYVRAGRAKDRVVLNAHIIDLDVDVIDANAATIGKIARGADVDRASLETRDGIVRFKRGAVFAFHAFYNDELLPAARERITTERQDELWAVIEQETVPLMLLGADEITISLPRAFEELGLVPMAVAHLQTSARCRVAVTHTGKTEPGARGHERAMKAAESPHKLQEDNEALMRALDDVVEFLPEGDHDYACKLRHKIEHLYTSTDERGQLGIRDVSGKRVRNLMQLRERATKLIQKATANARR